MSRRQSRKPIGRRVQRGAGDKPAPPSARTGNGGKVSDAIRGRLRADVRGARLTDDEAGRVGTGDPFAGEGARGVARRIELTDEEVDRLVTQALDCELDEPEAFVKMLLILYDQRDEMELRDSLHRLMTAAYNNSTVHSANFDEYLAAVRQGRVRHGGRAAGRVSPGS